MDHTSFCNWSGSTERNLVTDLSRWLGKLSGDTRSRRRLRRLREDLVREHIEAAALREDSRVRNLFGRGQGG